MNATRPIALVTGAGRRIGRAIAEDLGRNGFALALHANRSSDEAEEAANAIREAGGRAEVFSADLTSSAAVRALYNDVVARMGPAEILVNNASVFENDDISDFDEAVFDRHFAVHLKAPILLAEAFARALPAARSGLIVNIVDQRVWRLTPRFFTYTLSKSALWTATQTMAQALAPSIRVNAIGPGPTLASERQTPEEFDRQQAALPLGRGPELGEFGATIRYLFGASSVTGQMIALDGGQHLAWQTPDVADIAE